MARVMKVTTELHPDDNQVSSVVTCRTSPYRRIACLRAKLRSKLENRFLNAYVNVILPRLNSGCADYGRHDHCNPQRL